MGSYQSEIRYYLHVQLLEIEPPIWRKIIVPGAISLHTLHKILQVVMGWENAHLYLFRLTINKKTTLYGLPDPEWEHAETRIRDSRRTKLDATVWTDWLGLTYEYDLGDSWMHQITIEKIEHLAEETLNEDALWITPRCLAGERACPPVIWRIICQGSRGTVGKTRHTLPRGLRPGSLPSRQKPTPPATRSRPRATRLCLDCLPALPSTTSVDQSA